MQYFHAEKLDSYIDDLTDRLIGKKSNHHVLFSIESLDGTYRHTVAKGFRNRQGDELTGDTPFWIASITKIFIAVTILRLYEEKKLQLNDRIGRHIPGPLLKDLQVGKERDCRETLTIDHLLRHASGLPDYLELKQEGNKTLVDRVLEGEDQSWTIEDVVRIVKNSHKILWEPQDISGNRYKIRYSDTNYQLLIEIIGNVSGLTLQEAFERYIFKPLGLTQTWLPSGKRESQVASVWVKNLVFDDKPLAFASFHDLVSTASDLNRFMRALIQGEIFLHADTFRLMVSPMRTFGFGGSLIAPGWPIQYGRGMMRFQLPSIFTRFNKVPAVIGHTGATGSWLFYCEAYKLIFSGTVSQVTSAPVPFSAIPEVLGMLNKNILA